MFKRSTHFKRIMFLTLFISSFSFASDNQNDELISNRIRKRKVSDFYQSDLNQTEGFSEFSEIDQSNSELHEKQIKIISDCSHSMHTPVKDQKISILPVLTPVNYYDNPFSSLSCHSDEFQGSPIVLLKIHNNLHMQENPPFFLSSFNSWGPLPSESEEDEQNNYVILPKKNTNSDSTYYSKLNFPPKNIQEYNQMEILFRDDVVNLR